MRPRGYAFGAPISRHHLDRGRQESIYTILIGNPSPPADHGTLAEWFARAVARERAWGTWAGVFVLIARTLLEGMRW